MCLVRSRFSCQHECCRVLRTVEGNKNRCRCHKTSTIEVGFKCFECAPPRRPKRSGYYGYQGSETSSDEEGLEEKEQKDQYEWVDLDKAQEADLIKPIDYDKLIEQFDARKITHDLLTRFERVTGCKPHRLLRRGIVFSHRDLEGILNRHENKEPFFIYAGRGPSTTSTHLGHVVAFDFAKWLSDVFKMPLLIMLSDFEKMLRDDKSEDRFDFHDKSRTYKAYARENAKDIISIGCNPDRTFIYSNLGFPGGNFFSNTLRISEVLPLVYLYSHCGIKAGEEYDKKIGVFYFPVVLAAGAFASSFPSIFPHQKSQTTEIPCLVACALDEDPFIQLTRSVTDRLGTAKPSILHIKYLPALQGSSLKMSSSLESSAIFVSDTHEQILQKINEHAFCGGLGEPVARTHDPDCNVCFQYLSFFLEVRASNYPDASCLVNSRQDDKELDEIRRDYISGKMSADDMKRRCTGEVMKICNSLQKRRSEITELLLKSVIMDTRTE